ncbi:agmatinase [Halobacterium noricense]|uniref:agmatinase n=1 Tax=Halobacterium noricense TaxID=223182 RepID=UPI001E5FE96F|nr:agmatinase [Halobacterium noricense]UHH24741.1 agmatinase [Halobacterium noricense]
MFPGASPVDESADAPFADADYVAVGAPLDTSTSFRPGARFGPDRIRKFARTFEDFHPTTGTHFSELHVADHGDVHAWHDTAAYLDYLEGVLTDVHWADAVPVLLGGEHTVSVAGVRAADPDVFVALDAHLDLREELDGDPLSHSTVTRHALDVADEAVVVGARSGNETEWERATEGDLTVVTPEDAARMYSAEPSVADAPEDAADWMPDVDGSVYLSVDIDAADPAYAPGTGTPEPFGLDSATMRDLVRELAPQSVGFDVVEVNDRDDGQAATLAAKLVREFVHAHADA